MLRDSLIQASLQGSVVVLLLAVGLKLSPSVSPKVRVWLWRLVLVKFVLGLVPFGAVTLRVLPSAPTPVAVVDSGPVLPTTDFQVDSASLQTSHLAATVSEPVVSTPASTVAHPLDPLMVAWAIGAGLFGLASALRAIRSKNSLRAATPVTDTETLTIVRSLAVAAGLRRAPAIVRSEHVQTAMVLGGMRPTVVLPTENADPEDLRLMLAHEMAHLKNRDLVWNAGVAAVQSLFFFHPLVWLATRACFQAQESAADEDAIRLTKTSPRRYAEMLVRATVVRRSSLHSAVAGLPVVGSTSNMQERLKNMRYFTSKPTFAKLAFSALFAGAVVALTPAYRFAGVPIEPSLQIQQPPAAAPRAVPDINPAGQAAPVPAPAIPARPAVGRHVPRPAVAPPRARGIGIIAPRAQVHVAPQLYRRMEMQVQSLQKSVQVRFDQVDIRQAISILCQGAGVSYSITQDVHGKVTLHAQNVNGEAALRNLTRQVGARVAFRDGIYEISSGDTLINPFFGGRGPSPRPGRGRVGGNVFGGSVSAPAAGGFGGGGVFGAPPANPGHGAIGGGFGGGGAFGAPSVNPGHGAIGGGGGFGGGGAFGAPSANPGHGAIGGFGAGGLGGGGLAPAQSGTRGLGGSSTTQRPHSARGGNGEAGGGVGGSQGGSFGNGGIGGGQGGAGGGSSSGR